MADAGGGGDAQEGGDHHVPPELPSGLSDLGRARWGELSPWFDLKNNRTAYCKKCKRDYKLDKDWATKNAAAHLRSSHEKENIPEWARAAPASSSSSSSSPSSSSSAAASSPASSSSSSRLPAEDVGRVLAEAGILGDWPEDLRARHDVQQMVSLLAPGYDVPGRTAFRSLMERVMDTTLAEMSAFIKECFAIDGKWVSLHGDSDKWTSPYKHHHLSLSITGLDKDFVLRTFHLALEPVPAEAVYGVLADTWKTALDRHEIPASAIHVMNTDGEAVMVKAVRDGMGWEWAHCWNHVLNLVHDDVAYTREKGKAVLNKDCFYGLACFHVSTILAPFALSHKRRGILASLCRQKSIKELAPVFDMPTRWWIKLRMLERFVHFHPVFGALTPKEAAKIFEISGETENQWVESLAWFQEHMKGNLSRAPLTDLIEVLRPADIASAILETRNFVNASVILPLIAYLEKTWKEAEKNDVLHAGVRAMAASFHTCLTRRKTSVSAQTIRRLELATFLDPVTHMWLCEDTVARVSASINEEAARHLPPDAERCDMKISSRERAFMGGTEYTVKVPTNGTMPLKAPREEGRAFIRELLGMSGEAPYALDFWRERADTYPTLSLIARDFLSLRAGSSTSEAAFSVAKHGMPMHRSRTDVTKAGRRFVARMELRRRMVEGRGGSPRPDPASVAAYVSKIRAVLGRAFPAVFGSGASAASSAAALPSMDEGIDVGEEQDILLQEGLIAHDGTGYFVEYVYAGLPELGEGAYAGSKRPREDEEGEGAGAGAGAGRG